MLIVPNKSIIWKLVKARYRISAEHKEQNVGGVYWYMEN
jgi:hypothetical protein